MTFDTIGCSDVHRGGDAKEIKRILKRIKKLPMNNHSGDRMTFIGDGIHNSISESVALDQAAKRVQHMNERELAELAQRVWKSMPEFMAQYEAWLREVNGHEI